MVRPTKLAVPAVTLLLLTACGGGSSSSDNGLTTFEDAAVVIGQDDFVSTDSDVFGNSLYGNPGWDGSNLYLTDFTKNRILVFAGLPTENGASPSFAINSVTDADDSVSNLRGPETVQYADGKLFILDYDNYRALIIDSAPTADGPVVSAVVGQASLGSFSSTCDGATFLEPESLFVVGTKLIVADSSHNRVLVWNTIPESSGQAADLVLGQTGFTSCDADVSASAFSYPTDAWSDGTRLFVADAGNNRVLGWNSFPTVNGQAADFVLGQSDFASYGFGTSRSTLSNPYYLSSNGSQLFVSDADNNRVLVWSSLPSETGALPDLVLGQGDFTHGAANDADQDGASDSAPAANTFSHPRGVRVIDDVLAVADGINHRFLLFK
jgi:hypothetical protein